jgi:hypothetical protein
MLVSRNWWLRVLWSVFGILTLVGGRTDVSAYDVTLLAPDAPYEVIPIESDFRAQQWYLGTLQQFPVMYEFFISEPTVVPISLRVPAGVDVQVMRPTLLVVRDVDGRGVEEVARLLFDEDMWVEERDRRSRLSYRRAPDLTLDLMAGTYRIEVSTPNNDGAYMLVMGVNSGAPAWGQSVVAVRALYDFYGTPTVLMVRSPVVYYPLGSGIVLILIGLTWWFRHRLLPQR